MNRTFAAGCLSICSLFASPGDVLAADYNTQFQLTCPGRETMTVTKARYGLTTIMWPGHHFQIASGVKRSQTESGEKVSIILFRNGDQMIVNRADRDTWFAYDGDDDLVPCSRTSNRENRTITLQRTDSAGNVES